MATGPGGGFSFSNFLDQYESGVPKVVAAVASKTSTTTVAARGSDDRRIGDSRRDEDDSPRVRKERPIPIGVPSRNIGESKANTSSPLHTFTPPISKALAAAEGDSSDKKRKLEENGNGVPAKKSRFEGMTKEQKVAEVKRLKALKAARDAARANGSSTKDGNGSGSAPSNPNSPVTADAPGRKPAKGSYAEIMERAKQIQATSAVPAKIVHKDHKVEKKKLAKPDKPEHNKKPAAGPSRPLNGKLGPSTSIRPSPAKKPVKPLGRLPDPKKSEPAKPAPAKPKVPVIEYAGTARPAANAKPSSSSKPAARPSDRDPRDRDVREHRRGGRDDDHYGRVGYDDRWEREMEKRYSSKSYSYAESEEEDYYSDSDDMEATGIDILEEEELSRKTGVREDIEAERLEKELARKKKQKAMGRR